MVCVEGQVTGRDEEQSLPTTHASLSISLAYFWDTDCVVVEPGKKRKLRDAQFKERWVLMVTANLGEVSRP